MQGRRGREMQRAGLVLVAAVLALSVLPVCEAIFTKVKQGQQKCFIELLHANKVVLLTYESPDQASLPHEPEQQKSHVGILFQVVNHKGRVYDQRLDTKGRVSFVSPHNGEHRLCFSVEGNSLGQDFRVHIDIQQTMSEEINNDHIVKREHLSGIDLRVRQLSEKIDQVKSEQQYFRDRESRFFLTTESTNVRSQWCSIWQILGMAVVTCFNLFYLQYYFTSKQVV